MAHFQMSGSSRRNNTVISVGCICQKLIILYSKSHNALIQLNKRVSTYTRNLIFRKILN